MFEKSLKYLSFFVILFVISTLVCGRKVSYCHCPNKEDCYRMAKDNLVDKEVYVLTNGSSDYKQWNWDAVSAVIATENFKDDYHLMCLAHSKQLKYGFMVDVLVSSNLSSSNPDVPDWIEKVTARAATTLSDIVIVNLMPLFIDNDLKYSSDDLIDLMADLHDQLHINSVDCAVPWRPPYNDGEQISLTSRLTPYCDHFIIGPDSYMDVKGLVCKARATMPITKLVFGIDEYMSDGVTNDKLILGIPWHGYDYTCKSLNVTTQICMLDYISNNTVCDIASRVKLPLGNFNMDPTKHHVKKDWSDLYKAPLHSYIDNSTGISIPHQRWLEDIESLRIKYMMAKDLFLRGIAIWTGDDMTYAQLDYYKVINEDMWQWILHDLLEKGLIKPRGEPTYYYANTVTAVALSCLFGGILLGIIFTCIGFRRMKKSSRHPPFQKDRDQLHVDDFHDEDLNL